MNDTPRTDIRHCEACGQVKFPSDHWQRQLAAAQAEIAALRTDAERLDWLDTVDCGINHIGYGEYRDYIGRGFIKKIREVVDAAMKECGK